MRKQIVFKLYVGVILVGFSVSLLFGITQRYALACEFIEYSNYIEIAPNTFARSSLSTTQKNELLSIINLGKRRVANTFGDMISDPKVIIAENPIEASKFGSNDYASALLTPLGQCIVLGPRGQNIDVIAHEYVHAEVHYRVGWFTHMVNVPTWFNEGIALLVDLRPPYLLENIKLRQEEVNAVKQGEFDFSVKSYKAARLLTERVDRTALYMNLEKIKQGQAFSTVFAL